MRSRRPTQPVILVVPALISVLIFSACGSATPRTFDVRSRPTVEVPAPRSAAPPPPAVAADEAIRSRQAADLRLVVETVAWTEAAKPKPAPVVRVSRATHVYAEPSTGSGGVDWDCVATAETGGEYSMHGSNYSSAYGVMNQAVREHAPPDVADRILNGTATKDEQLAMASDIPFSGWAPSTQAKCGR